MDMDTDKQEEQTKTSIVAEPTFWTMCDRCNVRYKYIKSIVDKPIQCRSCKQTFTAKDIPLSKNGGRGYSTVITSATQSGNISTTVQVSPCSEPGFVPTIRCALRAPLLKNDFNSCGLDSRKSQSPSSEPGFVPTIGCAPLLKNDFSSNGLDSRKSQNQEADKQGNLIESDRNMSSFAFTSKELVDQTLDSRQLVGKLESVYDEFFKQGLWMMIKGFFVLASVANAEDLRGLLFYGRIIIQNFAEFGITDPGFGALLDKLEKLAADVIYQQSLASKWTSTHALFVDLMKVAEYESSEAMALKTALDEEVGSYEIQLKEAEASFTKAKKKEEMAKRKVEVAKRARIEVEGELTRRKQQLKVCEQSLEKAKRACKEKEDELAKAKENVSKVEEEIEVIMGALKEKEANWRSLCEPFPGVMDRAL